MFEGTDLDGVKLRTENEAKQNFSVRHQESAKHGTRFSQQVVFYGEGCTYTHSYSLIIFIATVTQNQLLLYKVQY